MGAVSRLAEGESRRFPRKRVNKTLNQDDGSKTVRTVFVVIRTMNTAETMIEQVISVHPTTIDAMNQMKREEKNLPFTKGIEFKVVGYPVTRVLPLTSPRQVPSPIISSSTGKRVGLTLVGGDEVEEGDEEE